MWPLLLRRLLFFQITHSLTHSCLTVTWKKNSEPIIRPPPLPEPLYCYEGGGACVFLWSCYRDGIGNFIRVSRCFNNESGHIPAGNIKWYDKGVLTIAKVLTQGKTLLHFKCPKDGICEDIKPHRPCNSIKRTAYNYDLYEFSEEIISICTLMRSKRLQN